MTVWVENPRDNGSSVWGCTTCSGGAWCRDHGSAVAEAARHADGHGVRVVVLDRQHGPRPHGARDARIRRLRAQGFTIRGIAVTVGISTAGVLKSLHRTKAAS